MNINQKETVEAAQTAFIDLLELAELAAEGDSSVESQALREEAQSTVLMLIAAVMLADGQYDEGEQEFIRLLVDSREKAGGEISYLNDYAARWMKASMEIPEFYCAAVRRDSRDGTDIAWKMRCRIQLIGNYASIADGKFVASERDTVRFYVAFLEDYANAWESQTQAAGKTMATFESEGPESFKAGSNPAEAVGAGPVDDVPGGLSVTDGPEVESDLNVDSVLDGSAGARPADSVGPPGWMSIG
jgi:hypothetical protein